MDPPPLEQTTTPASSWTSRLKSAGAFWKSFVLFFVPFVFLPVLFQGTEEDGLIPVK